MKKKIAALFCTLAVLCVCLCGTAFAAAKPDVELITLQVVWDDNYVSEPTLYFRNNSRKTVKYIDWYITAYNRVGDKIPGEATKKLTSIGPMEPFQVIRESDSQVYTDSYAAEDSPFKYYKETGYFISLGQDDELTNVYQDIYGNFFIQPDGYNSESAIYLTEDEIQNAMGSTYCDFDKAIWFSDVAYSIRVDKAVVTFMDGTKETIRNVESKYRSMTPKNLPFAQQLAQYQAVYNYQDYLRLNPDLADVFGTNQKALFEHFISSGMKEGRQGSAEFNLSTYKTNNPDLVAVFGNDNAKYYEHYISNGKVEGRIAK